MPSSHLILCRPLLLLPPIPPSIRVFSNESTLRMKWPKYWSFSLSLIPSNEHPGLIFFRMDQLDLLAVQGTLESLLQHHSSKASILQPSVFFIVQLSHPYMTTGKTMALTIQTFVGRVMRPSFVIYKMGRTSPLFLRGIVLDAVSRWRQKFIRCCWVQVLMVYGGRGILRLWGGQGAPGTDSPRWWSSTALCIRISLLSPALWVFEW